MIGDIAKGIIKYVDGDGCLYDKKAAAKAAMIAALPHIKEAMEYHGVQGAMNKQIIQRIEDQLK